MKPKHALTRLERSVQVLPADAPPAPPPECDADQLAREAAHALTEELGRYRQAIQAKEDYPNPADRPDDWEIKQIQNCPPQDFTFGHFERLTRIDPALATARWEEVRAAAQRELDTGFAAARALEFMGGSAWERATFMAVRERLRRAWQPRHDAEALLIDEIAQYELLRRQWVGVLSLLSREPQTLIDLRRRGDRPKEKEKDPKIAGAVQATVEAARMLDRLQRLSQNAIRTLLSLRRTRATVTVQNTGQVNVGLGPQLNVGPEPCV